VALRVAQTSLAGDPVMRRLHSFLQRFLCSCLPESGVRLPVPWQLLSSVLASCRRCPRSCLCSMSLTRCASCGLSCGSPGEWQTGDRWCRCQWCLRQLDSGVAGDLVEGFDSIVRRLVWRARRCVWGQAGQVSLGKCHKRLLSVPFVRRVWRYWQWTSYDKLVYIDVTSTITSNLLYIYFFRLDSRVQIARAGCQCTSWCTHNPVACCLGDASCRLLLRGTCCSLGMHVLEVGDIGEMVRPVRTCGQRHTSVRPKERG
jgi:hypothetical protein